MAKVDPNTLIGIFHGKLGGMVFVRRSEGEVLVRRRPVRVAPFTAGELANQQQHRQALAYVTRIRQDPALYAPYQAAAKIRRKRACDLAYADFRYPAQVNEVDLTAYSGQPGQVIRIQATDEFQVRAVGVAVAQLDGTLLEQGAALPAEDGAEWRYTAQAAALPGQVLTVQITASDLAGNVTTRKVYHVIDRP
jgi:hypothetical protein